ncbi:MAG: PilT/PilU family type 4a pilus ATPase [Acidimicrobiia bacterium]|nr:PilT/PilU family type 4a pilus ATPase [Acidimicrobiia bacterium]
MPRDLPAIEYLLAEAAQAGASDLHLKVGVPPVLRLNGQLQPTAHRALTAEDTERYLERLLPERMKVSFKESNEADFAVDDVAPRRVRVNAFRQRGLVSIAMRPIPGPGMSFEELGLPPALGRLVQEPRGLILVTGPTGSGKSTSLAAMLDVINRTRRVNIVTIEDPIEFLHEDHLALIHQREVGDDTTGFAEALRRVLRQDPDVILIGEMRDLATIDAALKAAETGHLVLSTLHTTDATETVNRVLDFYPGNLQRQVRLLLAASLRGIVSQRLLSRADGTGRVVATEVLINNERVAERIADPQLTAEIPDVIAQSGYYGMESFDQCILRLFAAGVITFAEGLRHATKPGDLRLRAQQTGLIPT